MFFLRHLPRTASLTLFLAALSVAPVMPAGGEDFHFEDSFKVDVSNSGGAPLLLTVTVKRREAGNANTDPSGDNQANDAGVSSEGTEDATPSRIRISSGETTIEKAIPDGLPFETRVSPFVSAGEHTLEIELLGPEPASATGGAQVSASADATSGPAQASASGDATSRPAQAPASHASSSGETVLARESFTVAFADFRFGRDNFNFGNDGDSSHGEVKPYSETLSEWLTERYPDVELSEEAEVLLYGESYRVFKGTTGRCYAFAASKERYARFPGTRPDTYDTTYDIHEFDRSHQDDMNLLQNDIVFRHFIAGERDPWHEQSREDLRREVSRVRTRLHGEETATVSYLAPERHHALLVYGYIRREGSQTIDFLAANNWGRDQEENLHSRDAVVVQVDLDEGKARWLDAPVRAYETADKLFMVDVLEEEPEFSELDLARVIAEMAADMRRREEAVILVENVHAAYLTDGEGERSGDERRRRAVDELDGVDVRLISENALIRFPREGDYTLEVTGIDREDLDENTLVGWPDGGHGALRAHVFSVAPRGRIGQVEQGNVEQGEWAGKDGEPEPAAAEGGTLASRVSRRVDLYPDAPVRFDVRDGLVDLDSARKVED